MEAYLDSVNLFTRGSDFNRVFRDSGTSNVVRHSKMAREYGVIPMPKKTSQNGSNTFENTNPRDYSEMQVDDSASEIDNGSRTVRSQTEIVPFQKSDKQSNTMTFSIVPSKTVNNTLSTSIPEQRWHPHWRLHTVVSGHLGWVRCIAFDRSNEWFATGSADRTIKIWDLAKCVTGTEGGCRLSLTGHIGTVRAVAISPRHPYLFSAGDDNSVKCWDLETNAIIRSYHGHLNGVYALTLHPTHDIIITGGRDCLLRVWDIRTKTQITSFAGHDSTVSSIICNSVEPQIISSSHDTTVKFWDLAGESCTRTLTHHSKSVRSCAISSRDNTIITAGSDAIKKFSLSPMDDFAFLSNFYPRNHSNPLIVNSVATNDTVLTSGCDNGQIEVFDVQTGFKFQVLESLAQPGSLLCERGILASAFDLSGSCLFTCETDKTIKIWREDEESTDLSDPINVKEYRKAYLRARLATRG